MTAEFHDEATKAPQGLDGQRIDRATLNAEVEGVNLRPGSLRDQLGAEPTLLYFLRHFG